MFKKGIALILSLILIAASLSVAASALDSSDADLTDYPVILIPGYSGSELVMATEGGALTPVWHPNMDAILGRVLARIVDLGKGLVLTAKGDAQYIGDVVGGEMVDMLGVLKCNPDGSSINDIRLANSSPAETNMAYIHENGLPEGYVGEPDLFTDISALIGEDKCFFFTEDWRMNVTTCAERLDSYIQEVKEYSNSEKVNLIAVSHGGEVTATYLSMFGYKEDVDNAVLTVPAAGGAALAYDIMSDNVKFDEYTLLYFIEHGMVSQSDYKWLLEAEQLGFLDDVIHALIPHVKEVIGNFGSIWDFIPAEYYDELKNEQLDPLENAALIEKSDYVHYNIMANYHDALTKCITDYGMNVTIIAGTGNPAVTGLQEDSDAIITTNASTGATTAPYGLRFSDGYTGVGTSCNNPAHHHVSPSMQVDGTSAYLPENTWYVDQLFHGMTFLDTYSRWLAITTLLTDRITDVYSDPAYPQFHTSTNASNTVFASFDNSQEGFVGSDDTCLIIKNISTEYPIKLTSITIAGSDCSASTIGLAEIAPGESVKIPITGKLPEVSLQLMQVRVDYASTKNIVSPTGTRTFDFTIMNGAPVVYDADNEFVAADYSIGLRPILGEENTKTLEKAGVIGIVEAFYNFIYSLLKELNIIGLIKK